MDSLINWPLISNPINWIKIILMLMISGIALHAAAPTLFQSKQ